MRVTTKLWVLTALATTAFLPATTTAKETPDEPIPAKHQERLLERFGTDGIDANEDGTLTRQEVRAFFAAHRDESGHGRPHGHRPGFGHRRGIGHLGPGHRHMLLLEQLEHLQSDSPPAGFDLSRHPEADLDGDGKLDSGEWTRFAGPIRQRMLARLSQRFADLDADTNGLVSDEELAEFTSRQRQEARERLMEWRPEADTDADGVISDAELDAFREARKAERRALLLERHPEADVDGDGVLSKEEAAEFRPPPNRHMRGRHESIGREERHDFNEPGSGFEH